MLRFPDSSSIFSGISVTGPCLPEWGRGFRALSIDTQPALLQSIIANSQTLRLIAEVKYSEQVALPLGNRFRMSLALVIGLREARSARGVSKLRFSPVKLVLRCAYIDAVFRDL